VGGGGGDDVTASASAGTGPLSGAGGNANGSGVRNLVVDGQTRHLGNVPRSATGAARGIAQTVKPDGDGSGRRDMKASSRARSRRHRRSLVGDGWQRHQIGFAEVAGRRRHRRPAGDYTTSTDTDFRFSSGRSEPGRFRRAIDRFRASERFKGVSPTLHPS